MFVNVIYSSLLSESILSMLCKIFSLRLEFKRKTFVNDVTKIHGEVKFRATFPATTGLVRVGAGKLYCNLDSLPSSVSQFCHIVPNCRMLIPADSTLQSQSTGLWVDCFNWHMKKACHTVCSRTSVHLTASRRNISNWFKMVYDGLTVDVEQLMLALSSSCSCWLRLVWWTRFFHITILCVKTLDTLDWHTFALCLVHFEF